MTSSESESSKCGDESLCSSSSSRTSAPNENEVTFLVIGDWGRGGDHNQQETSVALAKTICSDTRFIVSTGDNFYDDGPHSVNDEIFKTSYENIYSDPSFENLPWYFVLGNHDYEGNINAQIQYSAVSSRWNLPSRYYHVKLSKTVVGIFLDTTIYSDTNYRKLAISVSSLEEPEKQLKWLHKTLQEATQSYRVIIFGHHPMYNTARSRHGGDEGVRQAIEPILEPFMYRIIAYISGHEHALVHMKRNSARKTDHFISGAGSKLVASFSDNTQQRSLGDSSRRLLDCCGLLQPTGESMEAETGWRIDENGFFKFKVTSTKFTATAYDKTACIVYEYNKDL